MSDLKVVYKSISDLKEAEYNPRYLTETGYDQIVKSLTEFGFVDPLVVNVHKTRKNVIVGGHQRFRIVKKETEKQFAGVTYGDEILVPCVEVKLTEEKERELNVRLNKNTGKFDFDLLANHFEVDDLMDWGFDESELQIDDPEDEPEAKEDSFEIPDEIKTNIVVGDIIEIGDHRLMCGDSTDSDQVLKLMNGKKAELLLTDPPYGIKADKGFGGSGGSGKPIKRREYNDQWDDKRPEQSTFVLVLNTSKKAIIFGGNFFADILPTSKHWIVWDKLNTMPTFGDCELAWTNIDRNSVKKYTVQYNGLIGKEKERFHPTQKPIKIFGEILKDYSKESELIIDSFLGSGSTMVACHQLNRKCYGMELDPKYCQVIIDRMIKLDPEISVKVNGKKYVPISE